MSTTETTSRPLVLGTAGHIDHGKSTLVQALTGTDPDRLAEEKRRGITIELGFAQLALPNGSHVGIVDVPGHEKFVRQMIAGATGIDFALLCIAADDGVMPQTREHVAVLDILGIQRCVVALTKCDLVDDEWIALMQSEIRAELAGTPFSQAAIVPVSARTGAGVDTLLAELQACAEALQSAERRGPARMPIDRVFTIKGSGTVVTGTLWQGTVSVGDELEVLPSGKTTRVRSIQNHGTSVEQIPAGNRTALNLADLKTDELSPGDFLAAPGTLSVSDRFDARFTYLPTGQAEKPLESGTRVHVAHGTRETTGRILLMNGQETLLPRETTYAQIRLDAPLPVLHGDRFVVRSYSPVHVIGGGSVLNGHPRRRTTLHKGDAEMLEALADGTPEEQCHWIVAASDAPVSLSEICRITGLEEANAETILQQQTQTKGADRLVRLPDGNGRHFATQPVVARNVSALENTLLKFHAKYPEATGMAKETLRHRLPHHLDAACFEAILEKAIADGKAVVSEGMASHPTASAGAHALEEKNAAALLALLDEHRSTPPTLPELFAEAGIDAKQGTRAIQLLEKQGRAQRVNKEICFSTPVLDGLWTRARRFLRENGPATAAQLKEAMGTSRKYAIPLLEYFDEQKLTLRRENARVLNER